VCACVRVCVSHNLITRRSSVARQKFLFCGKTIFLEFELASTARSLHNDALQKCTKQLSLSLSLSNHNNSNEVFYDCFSLSNIICVRACVCVYLIISQHDVLPLRDRSFFFFAEKQIFLSSSWQQQHAHYTMMLFKNVRNNYLSLSLSLSLSNHNNSNEVFYDCFSLSNIMCVRACVCVYLFSRR
jgi:hypothetical protein